MGIDKRMRIIFNSGCEVMVRIYYGKKEKKKEISRMMYI